MVLRDISSKRWLTAVCLLGLLGCNAILDNDTGYLADDDAGGTAGVGGAAGSGGAGASSGVGGVGGMGGASGAGGAAGGSGAAPMDGAAVDAPGERGDAEADADDAGGRDAGFPPRDARGDGLLDAAALDGSNEDASAGDAAADVVQDVGVSDVSCGQCSNSCIPVYQVSCCKPGGVCGCRTAVPPSNNCQ